MLLNFCHAQQGARSGDRTAGSLRRALVLAFALMAATLLTACTGDGESAAHHLAPESAGAALEGAPGDASSVTSLQDFIHDYGYPAGATHARLRIPRLGLDAQVGSKVVGSGAQAMPNPDGPADIAWYDMSAWAGLGGEPGAGGNAIFGGHVDYNGRVPYAAVSYRGVGVFKNLGTLAPGDLIEIDYRGETLRYAVVWSSQLDAEATDWSDIWSNDVAVDSITLFTCGGAFDTGSRSYADRIIVRAERI